MTWHSGPLGRGDGNGCPAVVTGSKQAESSVLKHALLCVLFSDGGAGCKWKWGQHDWRDTELSAPTLQGRWATAICNKQLGMSSFASYSHVVIGDLKNVWKALLLVDWHYFWIHREQLLITLLRKGRKVFHILTQGCVPDPLMLEVQLIKILRSQFLYNFEGSSFRDFHATINGHPLTAMQSQTSTESSED